jgi:hypothetical protein
MKGHWLISILYIALKAGTTVIVIRESNHPRGGKRQFIAVYLTTQTCDAKGKTRTDLVECGTIAATENRLPNIPRKFYRKTFSRVLPKVEQNDFARSKQKVANARIDAVT